MLAEHRGRVNFKNQPALTVNQILDWADKHHQRTGNWPKTVSGSVLDAPDVAYSLGGDGYLRKPPGRSDFFSALARWQK